MKQLAPALTTFLVTLALVLGFSPFGPLGVGATTAHAAPAETAQDGRIQDGTAPRPPAKPRFPRSPPSPRAAPTRVSLLTMGPGDHPFARFGHTALLIEWRGHSRVYNFGTFFFDGLQGVEDFMAGRFRYWLSVTDLQTTLAHYQGEERSLIAQDLDLTRAQSLELARALEENARPENRYYDYDYYKDNCTTRVRDAIDGVLGGALRRAFEEPGRLTFREHTERLSADNLGLYVGLDLALGRFTDQVPNRFGELWVPDQLSAALDEVTVERAGRQVPLVRATRVLAASERPPPRSTPPAWVPWFGLVGLGLGGLLAGLGYVGAGLLPKPAPGAASGTSADAGALRVRRAARGLFGASTALLGLGSGLLGSVVFIFWFTKHWAAHQNANVLLFAPWALVFTVSGLRLALGRAGGAERTRQVAMACTVAAALGALIPLLPGVGQDNLRLAALMLPLWGGLWIGASALVSDAASASSVGGPVQGDTPPTEQQHATDQQPADQLSPREPAARDEPIAPETH